VARVLLIGGGCAGLALIGELGAEGHAVRAVTRRPERRAELEEAGAQCWLGDPDRIGTLRYALDNVTILCWLLGAATGDPGAVRALHGSRLEMMLLRTVDTTVRGVVYEAAGPRRGAPRVRHPRHPLPADGRRSGRSGCLGRRCPSGRARPAGPPLSRYPAQSLQTG
jgi:nucleoside-diphosphate-sugar epimerase